jgi:hypothetical protein
MSLECQPTSPDVKVAGRKAFGSHEQNAVAIFWGNAMRRVNQGRAGAQQKKRGPGASLEK